MSNRSRGDGDHRSTPPNIDVMYSLKVDNLTYRTRVEDLRRCFEKFGPIGDIYIPRDQFSRSSRGYAFIRFVFPFSLFHLYYSIFFLLLKLSKKT
jgi:arginine/serine-rich splicing factor 2